MNQYNVDSYEDTPMSNEPLPDLEMLTQFYLKIRYLKRHSIIFS